jgi:hypothetical protein
VRQDEAEGRETKQMEKNCSSNLEPQFGDILLTKQYQTVLLRAYDRPWKVTRGTNQPTYEGANWQAK